MSTQTPWLIRALRKLTRWVDKQGPPPYFEELQRRDYVWDYEQTDLQPWDTEPDKERLSDALTLYRSADPRAFTELHMLAEQNSRLAINTIGEGYYWGKGLKTDEEEGERWFKRAFDLGSHRGLLNYGKALFHRRDFAGAEAVFRRGVDDDWGPAYYWLARVEGARSGLRGLRRIRPLLERAAELGSPGAKRMMAGLMALGAYGMRQIPRGWTLYQEASAERRAEKIVPRATTSGETVH